MFNFNITTSNEIVYCPECQKGHIVERKGMYGIFYACNRYPNCKTTIKEYVYKNILQNQNKPLKTIDGTEEQTNIWEWIKNAKKGQNLLVQARPGTGKTTTIEYSLPYIPQNKRIVYIVFGKKNQKEAELKMSGKCVVKTSHSFGRGVLDSWLRLKYLERGEDYNGVGKLNFNKCYETVVTVLKSNGDYTYFKNLWAVSPMINIVELLRNQLLLPTPENIGNVIDTYNQIRVNVYGKNRWKFDFLCEWLPDVYDSLVNDFSSFDFTDFLHLPIYHNMYDDVDFQTYNYGLFDEVQDFNQCQIVSANKVLGTTGVGVFVGDDKQAIYGFRGALNNSMDIIKDNFNCDTKPLTTTFRSPLTGINLVNTLFPYIKFNGLPTLDRVGAINYKEVDCLLDAPVGSLVICRNNAPLIKPVLNLLSVGRKATIVGRNVAEGLKTLIKKNKYEGLSSLLRDVNEQIMEEIEDLEKENKKTKIELLRDRWEVLKALAEGLTSKSELLKRIDTIFSKERGEVSFSTIHRAKGLESNDVYILEPELLPSKNATHLWEKTQESNLRLIAITRHKENLTFVSEEEYGWWFTGMGLDSDGLDDYFDDGLTTDSVKDGRVIVLDDEYDTHDDWGDRD